MREETREGFMLKIDRPDDEDPDLSYLGEYYQKRGTPAFPYYDRALGRVVDSDHDITDEEAEGAENFRRDEWRYITGGCGDPAYLKQDAERLQSYGSEWSCLGIRVRAYRNGIELAEASVWGFESDSGEECLKAEEESVIQEALAQAKEALKGLQEVKLEA